MAEKLLSSLGQPFAFSWVTTALAGSFKGLWLAADANLVDVATISFDRMFLWFRISRRFLYDYDELFAAVGTPSEVVIIDQTRAYPSAHVAIIREAESFLQAFVLGFYNENIFDGSDKEFDAKEIESRWELAKRIIYDLSSDKLRHDFIPLEARALRERAVVIPPSREDESNANKLQDDERRKLGKKVAAALEVIEKDGPILGKALAKRINLEFATLRRHIVPKLKPLGVKNDGHGYYL
jgi:hypothetical protein